MKCSMNPACLFVGGGKAPWRDSVTVERASGQEWPFTVRFGDFRMFLTDDAARELARMLMDSLHTEHEARLAKMRLEVGE